MKILVVEDEPVTRKLLQKTVDGLGECEAVDSGNKAIKAFKKALEIRAPFDLITLDISMPEMDGTEVLHTIREIEKEKKIPKEKQVKILMVTIHSDKDTIITSIQAGCDDYIVKPFDREVIIKKLEKIGLAKGPGSDVKEDVKTLPPEESHTEKEPKIVQEIISRFKRGDIDLPPLPKISLKFNEMVNKGTKLQDVADLLKHDIAISSKLISVSNSTYYRGLVENKTLGQAITRLGISTTKRYVDAISTRALYTTTNKKYMGFIEKLWEHSLSCAYTSQIVSEVLKLTLTDDAFTMGLLHDIGKLILLQLFGEMEKKSKPGEEIDRQELFNTIDKYHNKFGAALLKRWKFSDGYVNIAMYHKNLEEVDPISEELLIIHFSNLLVKSMGYDQGQKAEIDIEAAQSTRLLKLNSTVIDQLKEQAEARMEEMRGYFV